jgi:hypothetical protein
MQVSPEPPVAAPAPAALSAVAAAAPAAPVQEVLFIAPEPPALPAAPPRRPVPRRSCMRVLRDTNESMGRTFVTVTICDRWSFNINGFVVFRMACRLFHFSLFIMSTYLTGKDIALLPEMTRISSNEQYRSARQGDIYNLTVFVFVAITIMLFLCEMFSLWLALDENESKRRVMSRRVVRGKK